MARVLACTNGRRIFFLGEQEAGNASLLCCVLQNERTASGSSYFPEFVLITPAISRNQHRKTLSEEFIFALNNYC